MFNRHSLAIAARSLAAPALFVCISPSISGAAPAYAESAVAAAIDLPSTPKQLLQNLKNAWINDWLVQSSFYSDAILSKVFTAKNVAWDQESNPGEAPKSGNATLTIDSKVLPQMTVEIIRGVRKSGEREVHSGFIRIRFEASRGLTVGLVRDVFGKESADELDVGMATDGHSYIPTSAGDLLYESHDKERSTAAFWKNRVSFGVKKTNPGMPAPGSRFIDSDQIEEIVILQVEQ
jgi:hypothetical protein